jgi:hypothetical protein
MLHGRERETLGVLKRSEDFLDPYSADTPFTRPVSLFHHARKLNTVDCPLEDRGVRAMALAAGRPPWTGTSWGRHTLELRQRIEGRPDRHRWHGVDTICWMWHQTLQDSNADQEYVVSPGIKTGITFWSGGQMYIWPVEVTMKHTHLFTLPAVRI